MTMLLVKKGNEIYFSNHIGSKKRWWGGGLIRNWMKKGAECQSPTTVRCESHIGAAKTDPKLSNSEDGN
jgi:hypothetical protein